MEPEPEAVASGRGVLRARVAGVILRLKKHKVERSGHHSLRCCTYVR